MWSILGYLCLGLVGLAILVLAGSFLLVYRGYRRSPLKRWRDDVLRLVADAQRRIAVERAELQRVAVKDEAGEQRLRDQAFAKLLQRTPVSALRAYRDIGHKTIAKLRRAGYANLARLLEEPLQVPGLGQARLAEVSQVVRDLFAQARRRFDSGDCEETEQLPAQIDAWRASATEEGFRAWSRLRALEQFVADMEPLRALAQNLNFRVYLEIFHQNPELLTPPLEEEIPDLEPVIRETDEEAKALYAKRMRSRPRPLSSPQHPAQPQKEPAVLPLTKPAPADAAPANASKSPPKDLFQEALHAPRTGAPYPAPVAPPPHPEEAGPTQDQAPAHPPADKVATGVPDHRQEQLALLEIAPATPVTAELVRRQYHRISARYAQEKVAPLGPEFMTLARSKHAALQAAATALLEPLGEPLEVPAGHSPPADLRHNPDLDSLFDHPG
jgi:hypothetical protein